MCMIESLINCQEGAVPFKWRPSFTLSLSHTPTYTHLCIHHCCGRAVCRREGEGIERELLKLLVNPSRCPLLFIVSVLDHKWR